MRIPAYCGNCGKVFNSGFEICDSTNVRFNNNISICPFCGSQGRVLDGTYDVMNDIISIRDIPGKLTKLKDMIIKTQNQSITPEQLIKDVEKEFPNELFHIKEAFTRQDIYAIIGIIIAIIALSI